MELFTFQYINLVPLILIKRTELSRVCSKTMVRVGVDADCRFSWLVFRGYLGLSQTDVSHPSGVLFGAKGYFRTVFVFVFKHRRLTDAKLRFSLFGRSGYLGHFGVVDGRRLRSCLLYTSDAADE